MKKEQEAMKTVTILLTKYSDWFSVFLCKICRNTYSHASISIDGNEEIFYSFNYKGFVIEKPKKYAPKTRMQGSMCIRMQVPESVHKKLETELERFVNNREIFSYSTLGVILCLLHIPHKFKNSYFCSQFVAELLSSTGAAKLKKNESLYLPMHFVDRMECDHSAVQIVKNVIC